MLKKYLSYIFRGMFAGIMIGIGGVVFLSLNNKILGATFFSIGLLVICMFDMYLYTGKIGYVISNKLSYIILLIFSTIIFKATWLYPPSGTIGNFIGTYLVAFATLNSRINNISEKARILSDIKLNDSVISILILSIFCGILMYIAVNSYKTSKDVFGRYIPIFMCVIVFILCGFEHCVANMFYFSVGEIWSFKTILYTFIMILGNSIGSILIALYDRYIREKNKISEN